MSQERTTVSAKRLRALRRYFHAWYRNKGQKPKIKNTPQLERWLAEIMGYANHSPVNNALSCKANFDIQKVKLLSKKLKARLGANDRMVHMDIFLVDNNPWAKKSYLPKLKKQREKAGTTGSIRRRRNGKARFVRIKKQHDLVVLEYSSGLLLDSARLRIVEVAGGGRQIVVTPKYGKRKL